MSDIITVVGRRIRMYRQKAGLSQNELGELADLHNTYIGQIERGEKNISIASLDKIINALNLTYEVFFAKINNLGSESIETASECYELIVRMSKKHQRLILDILRNISKITQD